MIYLTLFLEFFKIGLFTFGGGYAMIPLIEETVLKHNWLTENAFFDFLGICESTPGPIAINMATFIGSNTGGFLGSLCATVGVVLPSFIIIILIAKLFKKLNKNPYVQSFLNGVKPIVISLITFTGLYLVLKVIGYNNITSFNVNLTAIICFLVLAVTYLITTLVFKKKFNSILFIIYSAIIGLLTSVIIL